MWQDETVPMMLRSSFVAVLAALALAAGAGARTQALPTLFVNYTMNCNFSLSGDSGARITAPILPGTYQIQVLTPVVFGLVDLSGLHDMTACQSFVQWQLTGPGVSLNTTLQQGDEDAETLKATFAPGSTYTMVDNNQPSVARLTFSTTATGSVGQVASPTTSSTSGKGTTQQDLIGSAANPFRGALDAIVYKTGALSLTKNGKKVTSLKYGRYTFSVDDESATHGFSVQVLNGKPQTITSAGYKGNHNVTVTLKAGRWFFFTPGAKSKSQFFVIG